MNALSSVFAAKRDLFVATIAERGSLLLPVVAFLLLLTLIGGLEGNAWRRGRLYAGYYRLIFLSSLIWCASVGLTLTVWMLLPHMLSLRALTFSLTLPSFLLGWTLTAGRPVLR